MCVQFRGHTASPGGAGIVVKLPVTSFRDDVPISIGAVAGATSFIDYNTTMSTGAAEGRGEECTGQT